MGILRRASSEKIAEAVAVQPLQERCRRYGRLRLVAYRYRAHAIHCSRYSIDRRFSAYFLAGQMTASLGNSRRHRADRRYAQQRCRHQHHYGLAAAGVMPVEIGIAVVLGANVGTCVTAVLAAIGGTRSGRFVAWSHVLLQRWRRHSVRSLYVELQTVSAWMTASPAGQIAHAQTLFNVISSLHCPSALLLSEAEKFAPGLKNWTADIQTINR